MLVIDSEIVNLDCRNQDDLMKVKSVLKVLIDVTKEVRNEVFDSLDGNRW